MKTLIPTLSLLLLAAVPAKAEDISSMSDRWSGHIVKATTTLIREAREWEGITGKIPLPGGESLGVDDLLNEDPVALAEKIGRSYSAVVDGLAEARQDLDAEDFRRSIAASLLGGSQGSDDPLVIAAEIDARIIDLQRASEDAEGSEVSMANRMRQIAARLEANAAALEEAAAAE